MHLLELSKADPIDSEAVAQLLDGMSHVQRVEATRALPPRVFARLYAALEHKKRLHLDDMVPSDFPPLKAIRHIGINSLPSFRTFEKPMYRTADGKIAGRNVQSFSWFTGHGYFTVRPGEAGAEVIFDYTVAPASKPADWPPIRSNRRGMAFFVYRDMNDYVRRVSRHVVIGEAWRNGKNLRQYFILVRQDP